MEEPGGDNLRKSPLVEFENMTSYVCVHALLCKIPQDHPSSVHGAKPCILGDRRKPYRFLIVTHHVHMTT